MSKPTDPSRKTRSSQPLDVRASGPLVSLPPLGETDLTRLAELLEQLPEPAQPLELSALDGYLCGVLLQPQRPAPAQWLSWVTDIEGRPVPQDAALEELHALVRRRFAELDQAIHQRQWFDPWVMAPLPDSTADNTTDSDTGAPAGLDDEDRALEDEEQDSHQISAAVLPWITGFACAMEHFPELMALTDPALVEPLGLLFLHFDADDLEDADALLAMIETLEPPGDLTEAVQDIVRALMLIADVSRPLQATAQRAPGRPGSPRQASTRGPAGRGKPRR